MLEANDELAKKRLNICLACPLYSSRLGGSCNGNLYMDPITEDVSTKFHKDWVKGCNCIIRQNTRVPDAECVAGKW
ncbi:MAG: hypothetical protein LUC37_06865 [Prevotella sp.]|nr:hypothetical protein [Prevotella sp.]